MIRALLSWRIALAAVIVAILAVKFCSGHSAAPLEGDFRKAKVERRTFRQVVHRTGILQPLKEETVFAKVGGTISELVPQGTCVKKDDVVMKIDDTQFQDAREDLEASIRSREADNEKARQDSAKALNAAKLDVLSNELRADLETARLEELRKGPTVTDQINAETNVKNNEALLAATEDEFNILSDLAKGGYVAREEVRTKRLAADLQKSQVAQSKIGLTRLDTLDPIQIASQELQVRDAFKALNAANERVTLLEANIKRDEERFETGMEALRTQLKKRMEDLAHCVCTAPGSGVVVYSKGRWYAFAPGRQVWDGIKVMSIPDFSKMKVALTIDEARVAEVKAGQRAEIRPAGWVGAPFQGVVTKVAEKGRDEFELFLPETTAISGTANRQVFDVTVEIDSIADGLRLGLRTDVDIVTRTVDSALIVPRIALLKDTAGGLSVNVDTPSGPQRRTVKVVAQDETLAAVEGLADGDSVWVMESHQDSVKPGSVAAITGK
jgi:HlyD family secretion protein